VKMLVIDESSRATGSRFGGIQMYWQPEAETATAKKPKLRLFEMDLKKLIGIAYQTEELISDAPFLEAVLKKAFQSELQFMLEDAFLFGTGAGQPLGLLKSNAVIESAIEGGQTIANSGQHIAKNLANMLANIPPKLWADTVALYNPELLSTFITATIGANGAVPVWLPANGIAGKPFDTLLGRVAIPTEYNEAVGTPGDLTLTALSQYATCDKDGVKESTSMHVRFLYDEMAYKITYRTDGQPLWKTKVNKYKGAGFWAPTATLAVRA
jgi:HK97 family phage major capsid protein